MYRKMYDMSTPDKIKMMTEIGYMLSKTERKKVLDKMKEKLMSRDVIFLNENHAKQDNVEDDIFNEQGME
jgi:actin-like ATPase involved in cell morphogenesis